MKERGDDIVMGGDGACIFRRGGSEKAGGERRIAGGLGCLSVSE